MNVDPPTSIETYDGRWPEGVTLTHLSPTIGTEIAGIDLAEALDAEMVRWLRGLWLSRKVIFFRNQHLTRDDHIRFGRYFGALQCYANSSDLAEYPELYVFERGTDPAKRGENFWHMDTAMSRRPVAGCISILREAPSIGGDTLFADMTAAYEGLSPWLKRAIAELRAVQRLDAGSRKYYPTTDEKTIQAGMARFPAVSLPLVATHPETGRKILYACDIWTTEILGLPQQESAMLLQFLINRAQVPEYQCRFRWEPHSVASGQSFLPALRVLQLSGANSPIGARVVSRRARMGRSAPP